MKRKNTNQPLMHDLLMLGDDFAEHACVTAFLVNALATVMSADDAQQPEVVAGAKFCATRLQSRTMELKQQLDRVCKRYRDEHGKLDSSD